MFMCFSSLSAPTRCGGAVVLLNTFQHFRNKYVCITPKYNSYLTVFRSAQKGFKNPIRTVIVSHGDVSDFHHLQGVVGDFIAV